jgi:hypothetical protein
MINPQLYPLEGNLRMNVILTPPRSSDIPCHGYVPILNDPRVSKWMRWFKPIPFHLGILFFYCLSIAPRYKSSAEHAEAWFASVRARSDIVLRELEEAGGTSNLITVNECPVRAIREVRGGGEEVYLPSTGGQMKDY